jgi:hypothetical protein
MISTKELKPYEQTFSDEYFSEMIKLLTIDELRRLLTLVQEELAQHE